MARRGAAAHLGAAGSVAARRQAAGSGGGLAGGFRHGLTGGLSLFLFFSNWFTETGTLTASAND